MTPEQVDLFIANERLVLWTLVHYFRSIIPKEEWDDYISEGRVGLCRACKTFDPNANVTFSTYAVRCIHNEVAKTLKQEFRKKRIPPALTVSLDSPVNPEVPGYGTLKDAVGLSYSLEGHIEAREQVRLAAEDPVVRTMIVDGCTKQEAAEKLGFSYYTVQNQWPKIRDAVERFEKPPKFNREVRKCAADM